VVRKYSTGAFCSATSVARAEIPNPHVRLVSMSSIEVAPDQTKVTGNGSAFYAQVLSAGFDYGPKARYRVDPDPLCGFMECAKWSHRGAIP